MSPCRMRSIRCRTATRASSRLFRWRRTLRPRRRPQPPRGRSSPRSTRGRKPRSKRPTRHRSRRSQTGPPRPQGIKLGMEVADAVQADRANDGTNAPDTYRPHAAPGAYVPTTPPLWEQYARAKPWVLKSADQFRPGPPPALSSAEWARDYNEVKSLGGTKSTARTAEQTRGGDVLGQRQFRRRLAGGGARARNEEGNVARRLCAPVRAAQHGPRQRLHPQLGRQVPLQFLAARHRDPQWRPGRQRCHRARCRLDLVQPDADASRIPVAGDLSTPSRRWRFWNRCSAP